jgi:hypothetical protein
MSTSVCATCHYPVVPAHTLSDEEHLLAGYDESDLHYGYVHDPEWVAKHDDGGYETSDHPAHVKGQRQLEDDVHKMLSNEQF